MLSMSCGFIQGLILKLGSSIYPIPQDTITSYSSLFNFEKQSLFALMNAN